MNFKKSYQTMEFIFAIFSMIVFWNFPPAVAAIVSAYILSRSLFKKNRGSSYLYGSEKTTEFKILLLGLMETICQFYLGTDRKELQICLCVMVCFFIIGRGLAKNDSKTRISNF